MSASDDKKKAAPSLTVRDFVGLQTGVDSADSVPGGAIHQVNVSASYRGELRVRGGTKLLRFDPPAPQS